MHPIFVFWFGGVVAHLVLWATHQDLIRYPAWTWKKAKTRYQGRWAPRLVAIGSHLLIIFISALVWPIMAFARGLFRTASLRAWKRFGIEIQVIHCAICERPEEIAVLNDEWVMIPDAWLIDEAQHVVCSPHCAKHFSEHHRNDGAKIH